MLGVFGMWTIRRPASFSSGEFSSQTHVNLQACCVGRFHRYARRLTTYSLGPARFARSRRARELVRLVRCRSLHSCAVFIKFIRGCRGT